MQTFGQKLAELRKSRKLSQQELADDLGISNMTVSRWEKEESLPDVATILTLSKYFNYPLLSHFRFDGQVDAVKNEDTLKLLVALKKQLDRMEEAQKRIANKLGD